MMVRDQETLNLLLDTISRFVRERLIPAEEIVAETDKIPDDNYAVEGFYREISFFRIYEGS